MFDARAAAEEPSLFRGQELSSSEPRLGCAVFTCGVRNYVVTEVVSAACFRGELGPVRQAVSDGLACLAFAEARDYELEDSVLQSASERYRQTRGLGTAKATERWFDDRGISFDGFADYLERFLLRARFSEQLEQIRREYAPPQAEIDPLVLTEVVLSESFDELVLRLAWRVSAKADLNGGVLPHRDATEEARRAFFERKGTSAENVDDWCARHQCGTDWFDELVRLETLFKQECGKVVTPGSCRAEMQARRSALLRIEAHAARFSDEDIAREVLMCVIEDGTDFAEACAMARAPASLSTAFLESLPEELQLRFFSASPGDVFRVSENETSHWLYCLSRKIEPDLEDETIRRLLERGIVTRYFGGLVDKYIQGLAR